MIWCRNLIVIQIDVEYIPNIKYPKNRGKINEDSTHHSPSSLNNPNREPQIHRVKKRARI